MQVEEFATEMGADGDDCRFRPGNALLRYMIRMCHSHLQLHPQDHIAVEEYIKKDRQATGGRKCESEANLSQLVNSQCTSLNHL